MSFIGKEYTFVKQENFEDFVNAIGLTAEQTQGYINYHPNQKLLKDGDTYKLITHKELSFKSGVPFEDKIGEATFQSTITVDGNTLTQVQKFDDGVEFKFVRVYTDDELVVTSTHSKYNGTATRYYKAV